MQRTLPILRSIIAARSVSAAAIARPAFIASRVLAQVQPRQASSPASLRLGAARFLQSSPGDGAWKSNKDIRYEEVKKISQRPSDDILLVDVREPDEVILGSVPSSVNIPLSNFEKALDMDGSDFTKVYGFHKPDKKQKMVFYCKTGKRSSTAQSLAKGKGFANVRNYVGSWADWSSKEKKED